MDLLQVMTTTGGVLLVGSGILMVCNNPGPKDYERYATESLVVHLKEEVCPQAPTNLGPFLQSYCKTLVDTGRPQIKHIIADTTTRQNFLVFSIYETTLALPSPAPTYQFQTLGVMKEFYTYQAQQL